jgi:hypothetical protein
MALTSSRTAARSTAGVLLGALAALAAREAPAQTNVRAWNADGQTWIVFTEDDVPAFESNDSFYASSGPITGPAGTELIGRT